MGIRDKPTAPASPWQNGFAERLIGSIRRECVDHMIVLGEVHLRRILKSCAHYYNGVRTHRSLNEDAPVSRSVQRTGVIRSSGRTSSPLSSGLRFSVHTRTWASDCGRSMITGRSCGAVVPDVPGAESSLGGTSPS